MPTAAGAAHKQKRKGRRVSDILLPKHRKMRADAEEEVMMEPENGELSRHEVARRHSGEHVAIGPLLVGEMGPRAGDV